MSTTPTATHKFEHLAQLIRNRALALGSDERLPGVRALMREHQVSQTTVYGALDLLKKEGVLTSNEKGSLIVCKPDAKSRRAQRAKHEQLRIMLVSPTPGSPYHQRIIHNLSNNYLKRDVQINVQQVDEQFLEVPPNVIAKYDAMFVIPGRQAIRLQTLTQWHQMNIPVIVLDRQLTQVDIDSLGTNNYLAGILAARHLLQLGHRNLGIFEHEPEVPTLQERVAGFTEEVAACKDAKLTCFSSKVIVERQEICHWLTGHIQSRPDITAMFTLTHTASLALLQAMYQLNWRVPDRVSVIGFDNLRTAELACPAMTTIDQSIHTMVEGAIELLDRRFESPGAQAKQIAIRPQLVVRQSTRILSN